MTEKDDFEKWMEWKIANAKKLKEEARSQDNAELSQIMVYEENDLQEALDKYRSPSIKADRMTGALEEEHKTVSDGVEQIEPLAIADGWRKWLIYTKIRIDFYKEAARAIREAKE